MSERFEHDHTVAYSNSDASQMLLASAYRPVEPHGGSGGTPGTPNSISNSESSSDSNATGGDARSNATGGESSSNATSGDSTSSSTSGDSKSTANGGDVNVNNTSSSRDFYMEATQPPAVLPGAPPATRFEYVPGNGSKFSADSNGSIDTTSFGVNIGAPGIGGFGFGYGESRAANTEVVKETFRQQTTSFDMFISNTADRSLGLPRLEIQRGALEEVKRAQQERATLNQHE